MATLAELWVMIKGDDSGLEKSLDGAEKKTGSFASSATNLLGGAVAGAAVAAAGAILAIGKGAFDVSVDTQTAAGSMAASLGLPIAEAEKFAEVAKRVYGNNFADSVGDAADAVTEVAKQMKLAADDPALKTMTENAFRLRDSFGVDVSESVNAAKTLMENFGLSGDEAFDYIAAGFQNGLNSSDDFLDTIGEYSVQFKEGGATAGDFFSILGTGLQGGMLGTDKAADLFKEFRVRIQDGSETTAVALNSIGINAVDMAAKMGDGSLTAIEAFEQVQTALYETDNKNLQMQAGVALLGTQFEDLGASAALGMNTFNYGFTNLEGSVESLDAKYNTFGGAVEGMWRRLTVSVSPFTDKLLEMVNDAMPSVMAAFDAFDKNVAPAIANVGNVINTVVTAVQGYFGAFKSSIDLDASGPLEYWKTWIDTNLPLVQTLFQNILGAIQGFWALFGDDIMHIVTNTFGVAMTIIDTAMKTIGDIITLALQLLTGDWEGAWGTLEGIFTRIWETLKGVVSTQLDSLKTLFTSIDWGAVGSAIIEGVKSGISTGWNALLQWFPDRLSELRNMLPFSEPKDSSSPLRGLGKSGAALITNFKTGMDEEFANLSGNFSAGLSQLAGGLQTQAATSNSMSITVNVSGKDATYEGGRAVAAGINDELRARGF